MKIIFVCTGNTCRSPFAEAYFNSLSIKNAVAESRGLMGNGDAVSQNTAIISDNLGFNIDSYVSRRFYLDDFDADFIFTMSKNQRNYLIDNGGSPEKVRLLGNGIFDPFGGSIDIYKTALYQIADEIDKLYFGGMFDGITVTDLKEEYIPFIVKTESENFSEPWSETSIRESADNGTAFFIALKDNEPIGYIGLNYVLDEGYITSIAVAQNYRRNGVATKLINKCFSFARNQKLSFVSLEVRASNEIAKEFYEKSGFKTEGLRRNFYRKPPEDAIIMTRRFNF